MNHITLLLGTVIIFLLAGLGYATIPGYLEQAAEETNTTSLETGTSSETNVDTVLNEEESASSNSSEREDEDEEYEDEDDDEEYEDEDEDEDDDDDQPIATTPAPVADTTPAPEPAPAPQAGYTLSQVAEHADTSSCWTAVAGAVYDLTSFISEHPGGASNILKICGKDGTAAFSQKHGGDQKPENTLEGYYIGPLI